MIQVKPFDQCSLLLDTYYNVINVISARGALQLLMRGSVSGLDENGTPVKWDEGENAYYSWSQRNVCVKQNNPCLTSSSGEVITEWPIPTILVCADHYGKFKNDIAVTPKTVWKHYKGVCQYCRVKIPLRMATMDHSYPKEKGGTKDDINILLACKSCNNKKANQYPYADVNGNIPVPRPMHNFSFSLPDGVEMQPEWKGFIHNVPTLHL